MSTTIATHRQSKSENGTVFPGFAPLHANYVYCPNQFFDVCLPNCSRGAVRIVAYLLRQTLGWLDADGNPLNQHVTVSYRRLIEKAGVSRGAIGLALQEAVDAGFLRQVESGRAKSQGTPARSAQYELHWSTAATYLKSSADFDGFFAGEGCRSPVPNSFFDELVPNESLAVIKVVGTVLRHTVGYQAQFGGRRSSAPLAFAYIAQYAQLSTGRVLAGAVREALDSGYIERVCDGSFAPNTDDRQAARYQVRWLSEAKNSDIGSKTPPVPERSKKAISIGSETPSIERSKKATKEKTPLKDINKQHGAAAEIQQGTKLLERQGLDTSTAEALVRTRGLHSIRNQIAWLKFRNPRDNPVGMLRKAIDENWAKPHAASERDRSAAIRKVQQERTQNERLEDADIAAAKAARDKRKQRLLTEWGSASTEHRQAWVQEAAREASGKMLADIIRRQSTDADVPHVDVLNIVARHRGLPAVFSVDSAQQIDDR